MKNKILLISAVILMLINSVPAYSYNEWVHQYQVKQAYLLLSSQVGEIPQMSSFVGMDVTGAGSRMWRTRSIAAGAWREDVEDVVWNYGGHWGDIPGIPCGYTASITHFWDADAGDESTVDPRFDGCGSVPNAYQKALRILFPSTYGDWYAYYQTDAPQQWELHSTDGITYNIPNLYETTGAIGITYYSLIDFYKTGRAKVVGYVGVGGGWVTSTQDPRLPIEVNFGQYYRDEIVWEALGRVAHLIGDMSVPAHVHNDLHPCYLDFSVPGFSVHVENGDKYELWASGSVAGTENSCFTQVAHVNAYDRTYGNGLQQGGFINVVGKANPTRYLFYSANQVADHFGSLAESDAPDWGGLWNPGDNNVIYTFGADTYGELQSLYASLGPAVTQSSDFEASKTVILDKSFLFSMRAIAGLFYWFATETGLICDLTVQNNFSGGSIKIGGSAQGSPVHMVKTAGSQLSLGAIDQIPDVYWRVWNSTGVNLSNWLRQRTSDPAPSLILGGSPRDYTYTVEAADNNAALIADMKKRYNIYRNDQTEFDGTLSAGVVAQIVEQNSGTVSTPMQRTINGRDYRFYGWSDGPTSSVV